MPDRAKIRRAVLGVDAAWTTREPSGVALAAETEAGWRLVVAEASYGHFLMRARGAAPGDARPRGARPDAAGLVKAARALAGRAPDCVAIDMPVGPKPIERRRCCDNAISRLYGARKAAVHSPSATRPGRLSDDLRAGFAACGLDVRLTLPANGLIEVYPHAALIEFMDERERLPYKAAKTLTYWPDLRFQAEQRHIKLRAVWGLIVAALEARIAGAAAALPVPAPDVRGWPLKAFEDRLDAVVCAAVAIAALNGAAVAHGDAEGAIWVPVGWTESGPFSPSPSDGRRKGRLTAS
jgi:predicted RNase H-like nuclease